MSPSSSTLDAVRAHVRAQHWARLNSGQDLDAADAFSAFLADDVAAALLARATPTHVLEALASNRHTHPDILARLLQDSDELDILWEAAANPAARYADVRTNAVGLVTMHPNHPTQRPARANFSHVAGFAADIADYLRETRCRATHADFIALRADAVAAGADAEELRGIDQAWLPNPAADPTWLGEQYRTRDNALIPLARNRATPPSVLAELAAHSSADVAIRALGNPGTPPQALQNAAASLNHRWAGMGNALARAAAALATNPATPLGALHAALPADLEHEWDGELLFVAAHTRDPAHTAAVLAARPTWGGTLAELLQTTATALDLPYCPGVVLDPALAATHRPATS